MRKIVEVMKDKTKFIEIEFSEINEHIRNTLQLIVAWYTFYVAASVAGVLGIAEKLNDEKVAILGVWFSLVYVISTIISMTLVYYSYVFFIGRYKRLEFLVNIINSNGSDFKMLMPIALGKLTGTCKAMMVSLLLMLIAWIVLFLFAIQVLNWTDIFRSPFSKLVV